MNIIESIKVFHIKKACVGVYFCLFFVLNVGVNIKKITLTSLDYIKYVFCLWNGL
jgi:hypothetical protein